MLAVLLIGTHDMNLSLWQELMGRPLRLKFSERNAAESESGNEGEETSEGQPDKSWPALLMWSSKIIKLQALFYLHLLWI